VQPEIAIVNIVAAVGGGISSQAIGQGGVVEITPVGDDIILISFCPDIGLYGKDDLVIL